MAFAEFTVQTAGAQTVAATIPTEISGVRQGVVRLWITGDLNNAGETIHVVFNGVTLYGPALVSGQSTMQATKAQATYIGEFTFASGVISASVTTPAAVASARVYFEVETNEDAEATTPDMYRDFVFTRTTASVSDTDTSLTVENVSLMPSNEMLAKNAFYLVIESGLTYPHTFEIVRLKSVNTSTLTLEVERAKAGTSASAHAIATYIKAPLSASMLRRVRGGMYGTVLPSLDRDSYIPGDRYFHQREGRYYLFTGMAGKLLDTFTRANQVDTAGRTESIPGVPYLARWTNRVGLFGITNNTLVYRSGGTTEAMVQTNVGSYDFAVSMTFRTSQQSTTRDMGMFFRGSVDGLYGYYFQLSNGGTYIWKRTGGALVSVYGTNLRSWGLDETLKLGVQCVDRTIKFFVNEVLVYTHSETDGALDPSAVTPNIGANVGFRLGTAATLADTTIGVQRFSSDPISATSAVGGNIHGWLAVDEDVRRGLTALQEDLVLNAQLTDDMLLVVQDLDTRQLLANKFLYQTVVERLDDTVETLDPVERGSLVTARNGALLAGQVDDLLEFLLTQHQSGLGPPGPSLPRFDGALYIDRAMRQVWISWSDTWTQLTYNGPGHDIPAPTFVGIGYNTSAGVGTTRLPAGAQVGDVAVAFAQTETSSYINLPGDWNPNGSNQRLSNSYWMSWVHGWKVLTQADLDAANVPFSPSYAGAGTVRVYRNATFQARQWASATTTSGATVNFPALTTSVAKAKVVHFAMMNMVNLVFTQTPTKSNYGYQSYSNYVAQWSHDQDVLNIGTVVNQSWTGTGGNSPVYHHAVYELGAAMTRTASPGAYAGEGLPATGMPPGVVPAEGSLYIDKITRTVYSYLNAAWSPVGGGAIVKSVTANYTAQGGEAVLVNATSTPITITLPTPVANATVTVKKVESSGNAVSVATAAQIDGAAGPKVITMPYESLDFVCDGTNWWLI